MRRQLDFRQLCAPAWLLLVIQGVLCQSPMRLRSYFPDAPAVVPNSFTFIEIRDVLLTCGDPHFVSLLTWILSGGGHGISRHAMSEAARRGRFRWQPDRATYAPTASIPSFTTGGMAMEFDRRVGTMLGKENFARLTPSVSDISRAQYLSCWERWVIFCARMDVIRWIRNLEQGRGNALIDF